MKSFFMTALLLFISTAAHATVMTVEQREDRMQEIAKKIRRQFYIWRHEDVSSYVEPMLAEKLEAHLNPTDGTRYESELDETEIESLWDCLEAVQTCALYQVSVSASYHGGYGVAAYFIMLNLKDGSYEEVNHVIYSE